MVKCTGNTCSDDVNLGSSSECSDKEDLMGPRILRWTVYMIDVSYRQYDKHIQHNIKIVANVWNGHRTGTTITSGRP